LQIYPARDGLLTGPEEVMTPGLCASYISLDEMLPCVGQGAIGIEIRENDPASDELCAALNHVPTFQCVTAERAFLRAMGGGCQIAVAAHAEFAAGNLRMRAVSFLKGAPQRAEGSHPDPIELGRQIAAKLQ
jgi:hydroxymethylbilane synthase